MQYRIDGYVESAPQAHKVTSEGVLVKCCKAIGKMVGMPTEIGCQEQASNHSKRLSLRVMVVSIGVKLEY